MLCLIYSCGLRRNELLTLKLSDIDSKRNIVIIRQAKGKKDRIAPLSPRVLELLRDYYKGYKPKVWLFEGQVKGQPYSEQSLQTVFKQAVYKAGITKPATLHWLRHSYATHLLEDGMDIMTLKDLLGHHNIETTMGYLHIAQLESQRIFSPLDTLFAKCSRALK